MSANLAAQKQLLVTLNEFRRPGEPPIDLDATPIRMVAGETYGQTVNRLLSSGMPYDRAATYATAFHGGRRP